MLWFLIGLGVGIAAGFIGGMVFHYWLVYPRLLDDE